MIEHSKFKRLHAFKVWLMGAVTLGPLATLTMMFASGAKVTIGRLGLYRFFNELTGATINVNGGDYTLTEEDNGKTVIFSDTTGRTVTLPSANIFTPMVGYRVRFLVLAANTSGNHVIVNASGSGGDNISGRIVDMAGSGDVVSDADQINIVANQSAVGDLIILESITGFSWHVTGFAAAAAGITATG